MKLARKSGAEKRHFVHQERNHERHHCMNFKRWLKQLRSDIFEAAFDPEICNFTMEELADRADLCTSTVYKMWKGITVEPRMSTVWKLCRAVKMDIGLVKEGMRKVRGRELVYSR